MQAIYRVTAGCTFGVVAINAEACTSVQECDATAV